MYDDVMTRDEEGALAVRTVGSSGDNYVNKEDVYTRDDEGKLCIRVTGGGGGDQHNLGYYATPEALREAYPTAEAGDWAIVGSTDTVWIWDTDNSAWVDSDQKGQVTSVNNQTGDVTVQETLVSGTNIKTINNNSILGSGNLDIVQRSELPVASEDEVDNIYQFVGTTDATYTNGYFYKCVSDGQVPATYSWTQTDVQPAGTTYTAGTGISIDANNEISVTDPVLVNSATGTNNLTILGTSATGYRRINIGSSSQAAGDDSIALGVQATAFGDGSIAIGYVSDVRNVGTWGYGIAIGRLAKVTADQAIQIGTGTNSTANSFQVGNHQLLDLTTGTIPEARLADTTNATAGQALKLDSNGNAVWENITTTPATAPTLVAANWSSNTQTITVQGVTATNTVIVSPIPTDAEDYAAAGILCTGQATNALTFTCQTTPASDLQVNIVIM